MLFVVCGIEGLLGDNVILGSELIELRIVESCGRVLNSSHSIGNADLLVGILLKDCSLESKFALQLGWLGVESIIKVHLFAKVAVFPKTK